jgi:hypothetical protein
MIRAATLFFALLVSGAALSQDAPPAPLDRVEDPEDGLAAATFDTPRFDRFRALIARAVVVRAPDGGTRTGVLINVRADAVVLEESGGVKVDVPAALVADVILDAAEIGAPPKPPAPDPADPEPTDPPAATPKPAPLPAPVNSAPANTDAVMDAAIWTGAGGAALVVGTIGTITALSADLGDLQAGTLICCGTTGLFGCAVTGFGLIKLLSANRQKPSAERPPAVATYAPAIRY